ncbi:MAG: flagellar assembly protein FliH [Phenylobacterium sp.]|jgi:flagellar assembly protein FliH
MANDNRNVSTLTAEEEAELVKSWQIPDVADEVKQSSTKTNAMGHSVDWYYQQKLKEQQQVEVATEIKPLTAQDIETIRKSAFDEGLLQGHEDGFAQGREEGNALGYTEGLEKGQAEGHETGLAQGEEEVQRQIGVWQTLVGQLYTPLHEVNETVEHQLVQLSVKLAEAVVGVEVKTSDTIIFNTLKECIDALPLNESSCLISLSPEDFTLVSARFNEEELTERGWKIKAEPAVEQGGCIVESRTSSIDRTLKERISSTLDRFLQDASITSNDE